MKTLRPLAAALVIPALLLSSPLSRAQAPAGEPPDETQLAARPSVNELEQLVGPIALYPDDLIAIILPSATYPLELVKAQRFLDKRKDDASLQPGESTPEPVRNLLNYPEVVRKMNDDLDWTQALGEAVVSDQAAVMDAIQAFRRKAQAAGNLKSDDKQIVVVEKEVVKVVPADPEVIYVPQYQSSSVVVSAAPPVYYPNPYPVYYYPYPPGAALATGLFFGAMTAWAINWNNAHVEHNVNVNRTENININRDNPKYQDAANRAKQTASQRPQSTAAGGGQGWRSEKKPGQVRAATGAQPRATTRPGDPGFAGAGDRGAAGNRAAAGADLGGRTDLGTRGDFAKPGAGGRPEPGPRDLNASGTGGRSPGGYDRPGGSDAFGGMSSGAAAERASQRGASSRASSAQSGGARPQRSASAAPRPSGGARGGGGRRR